jgi:hypothetical protein
MNYGEPVDSILLKAHRAHARILNLETAYNSFMTTEPRTYTITFETDANTEDRLYSLKKIVPIPREFSLLIGDALNNLRSCLDHSVYTMIKVASFNNVKESDIKFPIYYSATEYKNGVKWIEPGLRPDAIKAINSIQPYVGGQGEYLCHIAKLNNFDKHKLLTTIWGSCEFHSMLPSQRQWIAGSQGKQQSDFMDAFIAHRVSPLKIGDLLLRVPKAEVEENMQFTLNIAFAEPDIVKGNPVVETLYAMHKLVFEIVVNFWRSGLFR